MISESDLYVLLSRVNFPYGIPIPCMPLGPHNIGKVGLLCRAYKEWSLDNQRTSSGSKNSVLIISYYMSMRSGRWRIREGTLQYIAVASLFFLWWTTLIGGCSPWFLWQYSWLRHVTIAFRCAYGRYVLRHHKNGMCMLARYMWFSWSASLCNRAEPRDGGTSNSWNPLQLLQGGACMEA